MAVPPDNKFARRRLLQILGAGAAVALAACQVPGRSAPAAVPGPTPPPPPPPPTLRPTEKPTAAPTPPEPPPPPPAIEVSEPRPVVRELELALSWPARPLAALADELARTRWRASITTTATTTIDPHGGALAGADLISPGDPAALAAAGSLAALPPDTVGAGRPGWHGAALATGNVADQGITALPLAMSARLFTYRSDLLEPPTDLTTWRRAVAGLARHDERFVRFAGIDLTPAAHDPRWLLFAGPECGPRDCYSRRGTEFFRSLFADPGIAFRRDHPRTHWPPRALAAGAAASGLDHWPRTRRLVRGTPLQGRLTTAAAPQGISALEGGGKLWLAVPAESGGAGLDALADLDLGSLSAAVAAAADILPADVSALADLADQDAALDPLLDPGLRLYDWRTTLGPGLGALAGLTHRALALGPQPVGELLARFELAVTKSRR